MKFTFSLGLLMLNLFSVHADKYDSLDYYFSKASAYNIKDFDSMQYFTQKLKSYSHRTSNQKAKAYYYTLMGVYLEEKSQNDSSILVNNLAIKIFSSIGDSIGMARVNNNLGANFLDLGDYQKAIDYYLNSLSYSEKMHDQYLQTVTNNNIGFVYYNLTDYGKSELYHNKAMEIAIRNNDTIRIVNTMIYLGNLNATRGRYNEAVENYNTVLSLKQEGEDGYAETINSIGAVHFYKGDFKSAIDNYQKSVTLSLENDNLVQAGVAYQNMGEAYIYLKDYDQSEFFLSKSIDVLKKINHKRYLTNAYQYLFSLYKEQGNFQKALENYQIYIQYKDSIFNEQVSSRIAELETKYQSEKKQTEIDLLTSRTEVQDLQLEKNQYMIFGISGTAILLIISTIALYSRRAYKLKIGLAEEKEAQQKLRFKAVIEGEEKERKRIAQELHDGLGQLLSTARLNVSVMEDEDESKNTQVNNSLKLIDVAVSEVRNISHNMMPNALISIGFEAALKEQVHLINDAGKVKVTLNLPLEKVKLEESQAISLYRIIQEIMNNALKYAQAKNISIEIAHNDLNELFVSIKDDGVGFDTNLIEASTGIGWENIISRSDLLNGKLDIQSEIGKGSQVSLKLAV